jgi:CRISPR/Cas system CMR-associated protein Cmr3 (group 5 of RAMP superfamily)
VKDAQSRLEKRDADPIYDEKVRHFYNILKTKTSKGIALSKIKKHESAKDGALAWLDLKHFYDQNGDKSVFGDSCLRKLLALRLEYNTVGGMDNYISQHELLSEQLNECDQPITEAQAKTYFLTGILDPAFTAIKDFNSTSTVSFMACVASLKKKAIELGVSSGPKSYHQRKAHNKTTTSSK